MTCDPKRVGGDCRRLMILVMGSDLMGDGSAEEEAGVVVEEAGARLDSLVAIPSAGERGSVLNSFTTLSPSSSSVSCTSCLDSWDALPKLPDFLAK